MLKKIHSQQHFMLSVYSFQAVLILLERAGAENFSNLKIFIEVGVDYFPEVFLSQGILFENFKIFISLKDQFLAKI